jgi:ABC-type antimicrobial peptide transport system permease subunit
MVRWHAIWHWRWVENLWADLRFALYQLRKSPGYGLTAIVTLAIGIGANAAIFTFIDDIMLRSLPDVFIRRFLYGVSPADIRLAIASILVLMAVAILAAAIPARRAASLDPTQALRAE